MKITWDESRCLGAFRQDPAEGGLEEETASPVLQQRLLYNCHIKQFSASEPASCLTMKNL